ncbi:hypothetical protein ACLUS2_013640 [Curtobacterium flaccumfaciens pv. flaccumfaciens]
MKLSTVNPVRTALVAISAAAVCASALVGSPASAVEADPDESTFFSATDLDELAPNGSAALDPAVFLEGLEELEASSVR